MAQATKKRAAAARRKKAPAARKSTAAAKGSGRVASRRATATRRTASSDSTKPLTAAERRAAAAASAAASLANTASLGHMARLLREVGGIICLFAALIALLALISFDVNDPGWSQTGTGAAIENSVGRVGAWFADVSLYLFGFMAYLIPLVVGMSGWLLFRSHHSTTTAYRPFVFVRVIGIALMLVSASGLADLHFSVTEGSLPQGTFGGGVLGTAVAWRLVPFLQHLGTTLVLLGLFLSSFTLAFGTSWIQMIEQLGSAVVRLIDGMRYRARAFTDAHDEHSRMLAADKARDAHLRAQEQEMADSARPVNTRATTKPATRKKLAEPAAADPLIDAAEPAGAALATGMGAALAMAREKTRTSQELAGTTAAKVTKTTRRTNKFDVLGDSLEEADALLADDFDQTVAIDRATAIAISDLDKPKHKPVPKAVAPAAEPVTRVDLDDEPPEHEVILPTLDPMAKKKKIAIKPRIAEHKQAKLFLDVPDSDLPPLSLLDTPEPQQPGFSEEDLQALSRLLEEKLAEFRITVQVVAVHPGPVITRFEMELAPGIKASRITGLSQDIARSMSLVSVRVVEVIAGRSTIGIEVPNDHREIVQLTEMLQSDEYIEKKSPLTLALGKDISGKSVTADLGRMPHLLVAGTTGSGKSVAVNSMLISLLYKATAKDVRLILIDPKMLELNVYDGIPHLLAPVVTDMKEAANALRWCVGEMERRYTVMAALKVRNIAGYNKKVNEAITAGTPIVDPLYQAELSLNPSGPPPTLEPMPFIVVVVDEFADMMMQVGKKAEELIARIAQKARAAGIHLILATQRPSVDVITGLIKANVPTRIAFQVSSKIDSRTILDQGGAESLLGNGDMLYLPPGTALPVRVHGAFVDDHEVQNVIAHIKQTGEPNYIEEILQESQIAIPGISGGEAEGGGGGESDALYDQAVAIVLESRKASISYVQRRLKIGYNRAARMIEEMEAAGVVSTVTGSGTREVLAPPP